MTDAWAFVSQNANSRLHNILISDNESGNTNKVPKLMSMDDYPHWKLRFETYINGVDTNLWIRIETEYIRQRAETGELIAIERLQQDQRKAYDEEKKAYALLSQAIPREILHQFQSCETSYKLWQALQARNEGNAKLQKIKANALKKEFNSFTHMGDETLGDLVTRFYHLLSELHQHNVTIDTSDQVECLADALPTRWDPFLMVLRQNNVLDGIGLNDFIQKLQEQDVEERRRSKRTSYGQDPSIYFSTAPKQSAKLETAFVSGMSGSTGGSTHAQQGSFISSASNSQRSSGSNQSGATPSLNTTNLGNVSIEVAKEHMALVAALVCSYDAMVAGKIGNPHLTQEDYDQLDDDEMELIDIQWALASAVRRAKKWVKKTGREITASKDSKYGFDMERVTCYNCGNKGHFARQCTLPKQTQNKSPFIKPQDKPSEDNSKAMVVMGSSHTTDSEASKALVPQTDEGYDWSFKFESAATGSNACVAKIDEPELEEKSSSSDDDYVSDGGSEDNQGIKIEAVAKTSGEDSESSDVHFALMAESSDSKSSEKKEDKAPNSEVSSTSDSNSNEPSCSKCKVSHPR